MADQAVTPQEDPLLKQSLSGHLVFWTLLLFGSALWAGWDEFVTKRPYKDYQAAFIEAYDKVLVYEHVDQQARETTARNSEQYKALAATIAAEEERTKDRKAELTKEAALIAAQIAAINAVLKNPNGELAMLQNRLEHYKDEKKRAYYSAKIEKLTNQDKFEVAMPKPDGATEAVSDTINNLKAKTEELKAKRTRLSAESARLDSVRADAFREQQQFVDATMPGLTPDAITGLRRALDDYEIGIKQTHVADVELVERCHTCHTGIAEPVAITREKLARAGVEDEMLQNMFVSHPRPKAMDGEPDLLEIHPPERFGCSPCHNGNGSGTISTHLAHGQNKHWLWKLYEKDNFEAGCQQCHQDSIWLDGAPVLNRGRELFYQRGCAGCHKREGYQREVEALQDVASALKSNASRAVAARKEMRDIQAVIDDEASADDAIEKAFSRKNAVTMALSEVETELATLRAQQRELNFERKMQGPNLKEIKAKLNRKWLVPWLKNPQAFRPTTKMPQFRFNDKQVKAIAAYLWQNAIDLKADKQPQGNAEKGKELFEQRGCMGCHGLEAEHGKAGGVFAADLSRVGEKSNYDYMVSWIYNPRKRLAPYSPAKKAKDGKGDVLPADFAAAGKPAVWDREHTECPSTGEEMIVENMTVMPSLRLTIEEARDIATYLMGRKKDGADYSNPGYDFPTNPTPADLAYGEQLVKHFGCAGCHEISGLEEEGPIGTELTVWGSKPLERLDYGLLTYDLKRKKDIDGDGEPDKYNHKSFIMNKLRKPEIWDQGKEHVKGEFEVLRMPNFHLSVEDRKALTTFMLGSVDSRLPSRMYYNTEGPAKDIEEGWWVVKKYNCQGCHQFLANAVGDRRPRIQTLEWFYGDGGENVGEAPPSLVGQGFRTNAKWLAKFLANPALTDDPAKIHRNGVREYLKVRMPTFHLTDNEVQKLVRFFAALAKQPLPQVEPPIDPLPPEGAAAAKVAFEKQVCLKCHITDGPLTPQVIAPSFVISGERLQRDWMRRWLINPQEMMPGTKMPAGLFVQRDGRWVFAGSPESWPKELRDWKGDHVDLLVRYMRQYNTINKDAGQ